MYAWWNAVLQDKLKDNMLCQADRMECQFAKENMFVK